MKRITISVIFLFVVMIATGQPSLVVGGGSQQVTMPQMPDPNNSTFLSAPFSSTYTGYWSATRSIGVVRELTVLASNAADTLSGVFVFEFTEDTTTAAEISEPGYNQTTLAAYTIPAGKTGFMRNVYIILSRASGAGGSGIVTIRARKQGGVYRTIGIYGISNGVAATPVQNVYLQLEEMEDIKISVEAGVSDINTIVSATFDITLVDN